MAASGVNLTRLLKLSERDELVRKAGLLPIVIPEDILRDQVLNPNYVPKDLPTQLLVITWLCIFIPLVGVVLRFLARFGTETRLGLDDWFSVITWVVAAAFGSTTILAAKMSGIGRHIWFATDGELDFGYMIGYFHQIAYGITSFFLHMTIMFFYIRIIPSELVARKVLYVFFVFHILYLPVYITVSALQCSPVRSGYDLRYRLEIGEGNRCMDPFKLVTGLTIVGITTDCLLFLLPLSVVWRLKLEVGRKVLVSGLFLLGGLACIASGIRLYYLKVLYASFDRTYYAMPVNALGHIEIALGLLTACLPMMRQAILLLPKGSFYSLVLSRLNCCIGRRRGDTIRVQKIDSRSTRITYTTTDIVERSDTELHDLREIVIPPVPIVPLHVGGGSINTPSLGGGGRSRPSTRGSSSANVRNSRHDRFVRDIVREAYRNQNPSREVVEIGDMWVMTGDGPVRVPIRYESPGGTGSNGRDVG
ncbi:hypothetical protein TWF225_002055 [Orbilia oligospora]|uniref:Rhodopsin domain-containing protein n=1 Tax=Orbilia oligospora TaxID=2813651 RepID=A0A8H2HUG2_ORBOL|nr:hypothetical protein TWF225_002055 [Orbilia oligospora]KAF3247036.1 hypothetical protein TWF128_008784 [Orbilia oligospora]KAF3247037.1 hypothetical protein TWF128_008784 [Orbilia oligospora]KAF3252464.1 hypothetical protein TWF217_007668 [Orbilia oligospora]KAF3278122.1 hypothetical protein TWF132_001238 [Orbilia oligospora]